MSRVALMVVLLFLIIQPSKMEPRAQFTQICISFVHVGLHIPFGTDQHHKYNTLNKFQEEITAYFNKLLKSASDKITEIYKLDKQIWRTLDDEEVECKEKIQIIETARDEQVNKVTVK